MQSVTGAARYFRYLVFALKSMADSKEMSLKVFAFWKIPASASAPAFFSESCNTFSNRSPTVGK